MTSNNAHASAYRRRIIDDDLDALLPELPALSIDGAKGVGKTATAEQRAAAVFALDDPGTLELVLADRDRLTTAATPTLIDEWQRYPAAWDLVRRAVDRSPQPGRFLLAGSASPRTPHTHSGAARIVSVRMRPMTLPERGLETPTVSLRALLAGDRPDIAGSTQVDLPAYVEQIVRGGFPGMQAATPRAQRALLSSYVDRIVDRDFPDADLGLRNPVLLHRWLAAYGAATATTATFEAIRDAATPAQGSKPSRNATVPYRDTLERIWISDPLPPWAPSRNHLNRLTLSPKHHLADPALAVALAGLTADDLLDGRAPGEAVPRDGTYLGALFESLMALSLRVFAQAAEATVGHLRTKGGEREVDFIVSGPGRRVVAVEVKLAQTVGDHDVRHLNWLADRLGPELADAVVITTGREAYRRADGIAVVPAALLGP